MNFDPNDPKTFTSFPNVDRNAIESNQLQKEHNAELKLQNELLSKIATEALVSAKAAEKSAKYSKICTTISLIVAILMLIVTALDVFLN